MPANEKPSRHWLEIVQQAATEHDPEQLHQLAIELELVLDERDQQLRKRADSVRADGQSRKSAPHK